MGFQKIKPYACIFQKASFQTLAGENIFVCLFVFVFVFYLWNGVTNQI